MWFRSGHGKTILWYLFEQMFMVLVWINFGMISVWMIYQNGKINADSNSKFNDKWTRPNHHHLVMTLDHSGFTYCTYPWNISDSEGSFSNRCFEPQPLIGWWKTVILLAKCNLVQSSEHHFDNPFNFKSPR